MSLGVDFTELAATQLYLLPHDVHGEVRAELLNKVKVAQVQRERIDLPAR